jgi:branched-chain amino acid transport system ATP-binding protein
MMSPPAAQNSADASGGPVAMRGPAGALAADAAPAAALRLHRLSKQFGKTVVLQGIDLAVAQGESLAIIGPNGAGKSTLFNLISGRCAPTAGEIWLKGARIDGQAAHQIHRQGLSRSFQISHGFAGLSVFDNLRCAALWSLGQRYVFWRSLGGLRDVAMRAGEMLERIGLAARRNVRASELSYAEQRALEIGITVIGGADVVLLDEPTSGMSRSETLHFTALIRELTRGRTLLTIEHDMEVVFGLADRIAVLAHGELLCVDTPEAVRADPRVRQAYLGGDTPWAARGTSDGPPC